jgi:hypothetical protein
MLIYESMRLCDYVCMGVCVYASAPARSTPDSVNLMNSLTPLLTPIMQLIRLSSLWCPSFSAILLACSRLSSASSCCSWAVERLAS